jgi:hypothetical protein
MITISCRSLFLCERTEEYIRAYSHSNLMYSVRMALEETARDKKLHVSVLKIVLKIIKIKHKKKNKIFNDLFIMSDKC